MDPVDRLTDVVHWRAQETDLGQSSRRGALVSTKQTEILQTDRQTRCIRIVQANTADPFRLNCFLEKIKPSIAGKAHYS